MKKDFVDIEDYYKSAREIVALLESKGYTYKESELVLNKVRSLIQDSTFKVNSND